MNNDLPSLVPEFYFFSSSNKIEVEKREISVHKVGDLITPLINYLRYKD